MEPRLRLKRFQPQARPKSGTASSVSQRLTYEATDAPYTFRELNVYNNFRLFFIFNAILLSSVCFSATTPFA